MEQKKQLDMNEYNFLTKAIQIDADNSSKNIF